MILHFRTGVVACEIPLNSRKILEKLAAVFNFAGNFEHLFVKITHRASEESLVKNQDKNDEQEAIKKR